MSGINRYRDKDGNIVRAIQVHPSEKSEDLKAFGIRYTRWAGLVYKPDSDEPTALHPKKLYFSVPTNSIRGCAGYLYDWVTKNDHHVPYVYTDRQFKAKYTKIPHTTEHARHKGPVAPTTGLLGGATAGDSMNLAQALYPEAQRIIQLLINRNNPFLRGWTTDGWTIEFPDDMTALYTQTAGKQTRFLRFDNIHAVDDGFRFDNAEKVGSSYDESANLDILHIPTGVHFKHTYTHTFKAVDSELDIAKEEWQTQVGGRIGAAFDGPAGANFQQQFTKAYENHFGKETSTEVTKSYTLEFDGPRNLSVDAVSSRQKYRRNIKDAAYYDYRITLGYIVENPLKREVAFADKGEFLDVMKGRAALDKAIYNRRTWVPLYNGENSQPNAAIDNVDAGGTIQPSFIDAYKQEIEVTDL